MNLFHVTRTAVAEMDTELFGIFTSAAKAMKNILYRNINGFDVNMIVMMELLEEDGTVSFTDADDEYTYTIDIVEANEVLV